MGGTRHDGERREGKLSAIPIVALDYGKADDALALVDELGVSCRFYKVGSELYTAAGPAIISALKERGKDVFLDLKYHDIPNTVAGAVRSAAALGVRLVTVHAAGGEAMLRAAVTAAGDPAHCGVLAVTVLTSLGASQVAASWGRTDEVTILNEVLRLAELARSSGAYGIVCSGEEAREVKRRFGSALALLVPGVRLAGTSTQDQTRVVTPSEAAAAGARYVVLGRAVTAAPDRRAVMLQIQTQLQ
jgi:orotidine-5'-phosphate decarboxylase